jgi:hypothetical protein
MKNRFDELAKRLAQSAVRRCPLTILCALTLLLSSPGLAQQSSSLPVMDVPNDPMSVTGSGADAVTGARTIPYFTYTATDPSNGATYTLEMVGANPSLGTTTTVPVVMIPLRLNFANGGVLDATARAVAVANSPIFANSAYSAQMAGGDVGQYGDVLMRAQANALGSGYHVLLGPPTILPTEVINVPQNHGTAFVTSQVFNTNGVVYALIDINWFASQINNLMNALHIPPEWLPIFLSDNGLLYKYNDYSQCCTWGFHGAGTMNNSGRASVDSNGNAEVNTFIWASYLEPGTFTKPRKVPISGLQDIQALSHEVSEWLNDPFGLNAVTPWSTPTAPQYGCTPALESGDPLVGFWFPLSGNPDPNPFAGGVWHPQDSVFPQWFLRESPSSAFDGHYTFMGTDNTNAAFHTVATGCN